MFDLLFVAGLTPEPNPIVQIQEEVIVEEVEETVVEPVELTLEEKIASNINGCDESIEWIRADNAECLAKPTRTAVRAPQASTSKTYKPSSGWFPVGQCTWWVWSKRNVGMWNNASDWLWQARRDGYATGSTPQVGAIAWQPGHVAYVESVNGGMVTVSEYNYAAARSYSTRTVPASTFKYIY